MNDSLPHLSGVKLGDLTIDRAYLADSATYPEDRELFISLTDDEFDVVVHARLRGCDGEGRRDPRTARELISRLNAGAREEIRPSGISVAAYVRAGGFADGVWHGDVCGCPDDRCIGYHHGERDECGCLPVLLDTALAQV